MRMGEQEVIVIIVYREKALYSQAVGVMKSKIEGLAEGDAHHEEQHYLAHIGDGNVESIIVLSSSICYEMIAAPCTQLECL